MRFHCIIGILRIRHGSKVDHHKEGCKVRSLMNHIAFLCEVSLFTDFTRAQEFY